MCCREGKNEVRKRRERCKEKHTHICYAEILVSVGFCAGDFNYIATQVDTGNSTLRGEKGL